MKVTIYNAISIDGYIATNGDDTSWVNDIEAYEKEIKHSDVIIYGRRTYDDLVTNVSFPYSGIKNIVYTSNPDKYKDRSGAEFTNLAPVTLLKQLAFQGHRNVLIAGGGITNSTFLESNMIDEVVIDVHPILLGKGIKMFEKESNQLKFELLKQKTLNAGIMQLRYKVVRE